MESGIITAVTDTPRGKQPAVSMLSVATKPIQSRAFRKPKVNADFIQRTYNTPADALSSRPKRS